MFIPQLLDDTARREFLEARQGMIGSSDLPPLCNIDDFGTDAVDVYYEKARPIADADLKRRSIHLFRGVVLEEIGSQLFQAFRDQPVRRMQQRSHPDYSWAGCNVDRQILATNGRPTGALEVKAPNREKFGNVVEAGLSAGYVAQLQWQLFVTGYSWGTWAVVNLEHEAGPLFTVEIERNDAVIEQLLDRAKKFWPHVERRQVPDIRAWLDQPAIEVPPHDQERHLLTSPELVEAFRPLMKLYRARKQAGDAYDEEKERIQEALDELDMTKVEIPSIGKVNYLHKPGNVQTSLKKLRAARPLDWDKVRAFLVGQASVESANPNITITEAGKAAFLEGTIEEALKSFELDWSQFEYSTAAHRHFQPYPAKEYK